MNRTDDNGKWEVLENGVEMLVTPSESWILANQPALTEEQLLESIRTQRNILLQECDWTQLSDSPPTTEKKLEWSIYRQTLRDFPSVVDLDNIVYPTKPE